MRQMFYGRININNVRCVTMEKIKKIGRRHPCKGGLIQTDNLLKLVIGLRQNKSFHPTGLFKFLTFKEKDKWTKKIMSI